MDTHFVTKIFATDEEGSADEIDDWLNGLTAEFQEVDVVGYATTMNAICITAEVQLNDNEDNGQTKLPY